MRENQEISNRARETFTAFRRGEGITDEEFAARTGDQIHPKTLSRLLTTDVKWTRWQIEIVADVVARGLPCNFVGLVSFIFKKTDAPESVADLLAAKIYGLKEEPLSELMAEIETAERHAAVCRMLGTFPPTGVLTEGVAGRVLRHIAESLGDSIDHRLNLMTTCSNVRRLRFMQGEAPRPQRTEIFLSCQFVDLLRGIGCTTDELDELIEHWVFDALERDIVFGIFDPAMSSAGTIAAAHLENVDAIAVFDHEIAVKRGKGKPSVNWFGSSRTDQSDRRVVGRAGMLLAALGRAIPYNLSDKRDVETALRQLLSPSTWADRSCLAWQYRCGSNLN